MISRCNHNFGRNTDIEAISHDFLEFQKYGFVVLSNQIFDIFNSESICDPVSSAYPFLEAGHYVFFKVSM